MNIAYPDYAFYTSTQVVLFFVNLVSTTISYYLGASIILRIFQKKVSFLRKIFFSLVTAFLLHLLVVYGVAFLNGFVVHEMGQFYIGVFYNLVKVMNPFSYLLLYLFGVYILQFSKYQSTYIMRLLYVYFICYWLASKIGSTFIFPNISDLRGWNYMRDMLVVLMGTVFTYILYLIVVFFVRKYKLHLEIPDNIVIPNTRQELLKNFFLSVVVYAIVMTCQYIPLEGGGYQYIFLLAILLGYLVLTVWAEFIKIYKIQLTNKDLHVAALNRSIEEFRGIKHDFYNILHTYSGYLGLGDYEKLEQYHGSVLGTMAISESNLAVSQRMPEHPAFFSLLSTKLSQAAAKGVGFQFELRCSMEHIQMEALDFCRVMAILMDNAIEAAEHTENRSVRLSGQTKSGGSLLFILSNDTVEIVDSEKLFQAGYSTKPGHSGQGLAQVREILQRYGNCTFNISQLQNIFTAYLEIKEINK